jgi:predicted amidohydrolase
LASPSSSPLILTPNACGLDADRLGQFRARAYENMVGVAMANYATPASTDDHSHLCPLDVCNGHSVAFSGIKFDREGNVLDHKLVEASVGEELPIATFDLDALRAYRVYEIGGDAYRKPGFYGVLSDNAPLPVFVRADSRRTPLPRIQ